MNTKAIIGLVIVVLIIGAMAVWLMKAPATPVEPQAPVTSVMDTSLTQPDQSAAPAPTAPATTAEATASKTSQAKPISSKTIDGMKIDVTKEGTGTPIKSGQTAVMLYTGKLTDGSVFDSTDSHGGQPFSFSLGAGMVIRGWDEGIVGMKVGEQRTLTIPADLAYGAAGHPPVIPQNATLIFDVTLVGIK